MGTRALALALGLVLSASLGAQTASHQRAAERLLDAMQFDRYLTTPPQIEAGRVPFLDEMMANAEVQKQFGAFQERMKQALPGIRTRIAKYLSGKYSERELGELRRLFMTPAGTKFARQKFELDMEVGIAAVHEVLLETPEIKKLLQAQRDAAQRSKDEFQVLLRRADAGEAVAQAQVATRYCSGGFPDSKGRADRTKCAEYRLRAAEQGNAEAQFALGSDALRSTPEQPRDPAKALEWFKKAADAGHVQARLNAGALMLGYAVGGGRPSGMPELVDVQAGEKMLLGLAESGNGSAQMMLADAYRTGTGVSKSPVKAEAQLRMAAGKNNHLAMQRLGDLYFEGGEGVPRNVEEALRWYRLSLGKK